MQRILFIFLLCLSPGLYASNFSIGNTLCSFSNLQDAVDALPATGGTIKARTSGTIYQRQSTRIEKPVVLEAGGSSCFGPAPKKALIQITPLSILAKQRFAYVTTSGTLTLRNMQIKGGKANNGGSIFSDGPLTLNNSIVREGEASQNGGCINVSSLGSLSILGDSRVVHCKAGNQGGGIYFHSNGNTFHQTLTIEGAPVVVSGVASGPIRISHNQAFMGGGIYISYYNHIFDTETGINPAYKHFPIRNVSFNHNQAERGGAIYSVTSSVGLSNVRLFYNSASQGGGIYSLESYIHVNTDNNHCSPDLYRCSEFRGNTANTGGAFFADFGFDFEFFRTFFEGNKVPDSGGMGAAIYIKNNISAMVENSIFHENRGASIVELGGTTPLLGSNIAFKHSTFTANHYGELFSQESSLDTRHVLHLNNSLMHNNTNPGLDADFFILQGSCNRGADTDKIAGTNNLDYLPLSGPSGSGLSWSPEGNAVDVCDSHVAPGSVDFWGQPRLRGIASDAGAVEYFVAP